jgi:hypothetical protein
VDPVAAAAGDPLPYTSINDIDIEVPVDPVYPSKHFKDCFLLLPRI